MALPDEHVLLVGEWDNEHVLLRYGISGLGVWAE